MLLTRCKKKLRKSWKIALSNFINNILTRTKLFYFVNERLNKITVFIKKLYSEKLIGKNTVFGC
jgi:hypothetical protein